MFANVLNVVHTTAQPANHISVRCDDINNSIAIPFSVLCILNGTTFMPCVYCTAQVLVFVYKCKTVFAPRCYVCNVQINDCTSEPTVHCLAIL